MINFSTIFSRINSMISQNSLEQEGEGETSNDLSQPSEMIVSSENSEIPVVEKNVAISRSPMSDLLPEILIQIAENIDTPKGLSNFGLASKKMNSVRQRVLSFKWLPKFNFRASAKTNDLLDINRINELFNFDLIKSAVHCHNHSFSILLKYIELGAIKKGCYPFYALELLLQNIGAEGSYPIFKQQDFIYMGLLKEEININGSSQVIDDVIRKYSYYLYRALPMLFTEKAMNLKKFLIVSASRDKINPKITQQDLIEIGVMNPDPKFSYLLEIPELYVPFVYERLPWLFGRHKQFTLEELFLLAGVFEENSSDTPESMVNKNLFDAMSNNNGEIIGNIVKSQLVLEFEDEKGSSLLLRAVDGKDGELADLLINSGVNTRQSGAHEITALMRAAHNGYLDWIESWPTEQRDKEIEESDIFGRCALAFAAEGGHLELVKYLVSKRQENEEKSSNDVLQPSAALSNSLAVALATAAQSGHVNIVEYLLGLGVEVDALAYDGNTALSLAVQNKHLKVAKLLLEHKANPNIPDKLKKTPLMFAIVDIDLFELLLEHGAKLDAVDYLSSDVLMWAVANGYLKIVSLLLNKYEVKVGNRSQNKSNALMFAARDGYLEIFKLLLKHGAEAEIDTANDLGETALSLAVQAGHLEIVKILLSPKYKDKINLNVNAFDKAGLTPLMWASRKGYLEIFKLLLEHGAEAEIDTATDLGETALSLAVQAGHLEIVKILLSPKYKDKINVNAFDKVGLTLLMWASYNGYLEIFKFLLEHGAEAALDTATDLGGTALSFAAQAGHLEIVKVFLSPKYKDKVNFNASDNLGLTPLILAVQKGHLEIVKLFLLSKDKVKINVNAFDKAGLTPLMWASRKGYLEIFKLLLEHGAEAEIDTATDLGETALSLAVQAGHLEIVKILLSPKYKDKVNVNTSDKLGFTPLIWASARGYLEIAELLVENGAEIDFLDKEENTALMRATRNGKLDLVKYLVNKNADLEKIKDAKVIAIMMYSTRNTGRELSRYLEKDLGIEVERLNEKGKDAALISMAQSGNKARIEYFIDAGANADARNEEEETPLIIVTKKGNLEAVMCLVERGVNLFARDKTRRNALEWAEHKGYVEVVQYLRSQEFKAPVAAVDQFI